jgi:phospholipase C
VGAHSHLTDDWNVTSNGASTYDLSVYGPNGFYRRFKGDLSGHHRADLDIRAVYDEQTTGIALEISNRAAHVARVSILNGYNSRATELVLGPGGTEGRSWSLARTMGWYDLAITVDGDARFKYRLAGHLENGEDSISDPAMGGLL